MMKVSDPIIFGHAVTVYFADLFEKYGKVFNDIGVDPDNGVGDILAKIQTLSGAKSGHRGRHPVLSEEWAASRHGRLCQRYHQFACAE